MPTITFSNQVVECQENVNLRRAILDAKLPLYNGIAKMIHCRGLGTCGTCAVEVEGDVTPVTKIEQWRLNFPPHRREAGLRLACQCKVLGDLNIKKHPGLWGSRSNHGTS